MKRVLKYVLSITLIAAAYLYVPADDHSVPCGYDIVNKNLEKKYPGFKRELDDELAEVINRMRSQRVNSDTELLRIPIVFHVMYNAPRENLDSNILINQLNQLNKDYRRKNGDANKTRDIFKPIAGDAHIEFYIHEIRRVYSRNSFKVVLIDPLDLNSLSIDSCENVKFSANGGDDALDPSRYLNIWTANLGDIGLLGYAYPPKGLDNWPSEYDSIPQEYEGVVLDFRAVGPNNPNGYPLVVIKGRTATHEIGHYLGLRHIWGDANDPMDLNDVNCDGDDGIDDTPTAGNNSQLASITGCALWTLSNISNPKNTCFKGTPGDKPDMWENYMDYCTEDCQNAFTVGQIELMRGVLRNQRAQLVGGTPTAVHQHIQKTFTISPNPVHDQLNIRFKTVPDKFEVYNALGKKVYEQTVTGEQSVFSVNNWNKGLYYLQVHEGQQVSGAKFIVQ